MAPRAFCLANGLLKRFARQRQLWAATLSRVCVYSTPDSAYS